MTAEPASWKLLAAALLSGWFGFLAHSRWEVIHGQEVGSGRQAHLWWRRRPFLVGALGTVALVLSVDARGGVSLGALHTIVFVMLLSMLFVVNVSTLRVPNEISLGGTVLALVLSSAGPGFVSAIAGVLLCGGLVLLIGEVYLRTRGVEGLGMGCVKAAALVGALMGWKPALAGLGVAAANAFLLLMFSLLRARQEQQLPCGALLAIGAAIVAFASFFARPL